jgi:hypothetical protein
VGVPDVDISLFAPCADIEAAPAKGRVNRETAVVMKEILTK